MKTILASLVVLGLAASAAAPAEAGCIKGAIVGGIAGHMVGHGGMGAAAGCAYSHHNSKKQAHNNANQPPHQAN